MADSVADKGRQLIGHKLHGAFRVTWINLVLACIWHSSRGDLSATDGPAALARPLAKTLLLDVGADGLPSAFGIGTF